MDPNNPTEAITTESIPPAKTSEEKAPTFEPITSQEQLNAVLADRLKRERAKYADHAELKAKAARLDEIEQAAKSDLEKATEANAKLTAELEALKLNQLRTEIAIAKGLDPASARFLTGTTREQIEADADDLVKLTGPAPRTAPGSVPGIGSAPETRNLSLADQIKAAEASGDKPLVSALKAMQLANVANPTTS
ncbi:MAG: hypothetical protein Q4D79_00105 [Propionibacteriaceae bacterium]|nr:hypothetical protein [Propionibacteriaceae bacterium]